MLDVTQVANRLGVSVATVYALVASGQLAHHRIRTKKSSRGTIRISESELNAYLISSGETKDTSPAVVTAPLKLKHLNLN